MCTQPEELLERGAGLAIDANRTYWLAIIPAVLQNHDDSLIDEGPQLGVFAAAFLDHRSQLRLEGRGVDALGFGIQKCVHGGQLQPWAGPRAIQPGIAVNVGWCGLIGLTGDLRQPSFERLDGDGGFRGAGLTCGRVFRATRRQGSKHQA